MAGRRLQPASLPRPPYRVRRAGAPLNVHEERIAIGTERGSGKLRTVRDVLGEFKHVAVGREASDEVPESAVFGHHDAAPRADTNVVRIVQDFGAGRFKQERQLAIRFPLLGPVVPDLPAVSIAAVRAAEVDGTTGKELQTGIL